MFSDDGFLQHLEALLIFTKTPSLKKQMTSEGKSERACANYFAAKPEM